MYIVVLPFDYIILYIYPIYIGIYVYLPMVSDMISQCC